MHRGLEGGTANVPSVADLAEMALNLTTWQRLVELQRGPHRASAQRREKLAAALRALDEVLPPLRAEMVQAAQLFEAEEHVLASMRCLASVQAIDVLAHGAFLVGENAALLHPQLRMPPEDRWEYYAQRLIELFHATVAPRNPRTQLTLAGYRFIVGVAPKLTGEKPTYEAVATHLKRGRPVNRAKRPL